MFEWNNAKYYPFSIMMSVMAKAWV